MRNVVYYSTLFILWVVIHLLLSTALTVILAIDGPYAPAVAAVMPEVWILSVGLAMFTRKAIAKRTLHEEKKFSKAVPIVLVALGGVMVGANIVLSLFQEESTEDTILALTAKDIENNTSPDVLDKPLKTSENAVNEKETLLSRIILDFKAGMNDKFEKTNEKTPVRFNEFISLNEIIMSDSTYSFIYQLNINKNDFEGDYLREIINDFVDNVKIELYYAVIAHCALAEVDSNEFFKNVNITFQYTFTDKNNRQIGTCEFHYKDLAKE